jgi:hypothetical protein
VRLKNLVSIRYPEDCRRIRRVALLKCDIEISLTQAHMLWEDYSTSVCASWLFLPDDDDALANVIRSYIDYDDE